MWATARHRLRLSDSGFQALTPCQYWALLAANEEIEQRSDYRAGVLASLLFNANRDPEKSKPLFAHDFFPSLPKPKKDRPRRQSPEAMFRTLMFGQSAKAEKFLAEVKASKKNRSTM